MHKEVFKRRREELLSLQKKTARTTKRVRVPFRRRQPAPCCRKRSRKVCRPYHDPHIFKRGFHTAEGRHTAHTIFNEPTPAGVADFREAQDAENTVYLPGVLGAVFLNEAMKLVQNTQTEIFLHPLTPEAPQCVRIGDTMLCAADDTRSTLNEFLLSPLSDFIPFAMQEAETLTAQAVEELRLCKRTHDAIETIYRPFVDYDHVERETNRLLETLKL